MVAALESGPTSWTAVLDAARLHPADDATAVTADQLRTVVSRLRAAGHWRGGDRPMLVMLDAGYEVMLLADLTLALLGRIRADRLMRGPAPASPRRGAHTGRPAGTGC